MKQFKSILVPTDLSVFSLEALRYALDIADAAPTEVILLHALNRVEETRSAKFQSDPVELEARKKLIHLLTRHGMIRRDLRIMLGAKTPLASILEAIERLQVDLVVMTTRGRTGFNQALVGSLAEQVVRLSPVPILVVKAPGQEPLRLCETDIQMNLHLN